MFPPKLPRGFPSVFCCPQQPSARHNAARLSAEPVTSHCSRSRKPHPPPPRLLFAFTLRRSAPFVCIPLPHAPLSFPFCSRCSVAPLLTSPVVSTQNPLNSGFSLPAKCPFQGLTAKFEQNGVKVVSGNGVGIPNIHPRKGISAMARICPNHKKSKKQPFRRTVVSW